MASSAARSPHHQVAIDGRPSGSPKSRSQMAGKKRQQRRRFEHAHAERVGHEHAAGAARLHEPRHAERRVVPKLHRIAEVVVEPAQDPVHRLEALHGLEEDPVVSHREVAAFDEREAEIPRQVRVLEIGLVVRPRREQRDVRHLAVRGREGQQRLLQRPEERREHVDAKIAKRLGEEPRNRDAVLERVAGARRRLTARADDAPAAVGAAGEIEGDLMEEAAAGRRDPVRGPQKSRMAEDERRRQRAVGDQLLRPVQVGEDRVEQARPLSEPRGERLPFGRGHDQGQHVEAPRARRPVGVGVDVVGHAVVVNLARDPGVGGRQPRRRRVLDVADERLPRRTHGAAGVHQLVEVAGGDGIGGEQIAERLRGSAHVRRSSV